MTQANLFDVDYRGAPPPALCPPIVKYAGAKRWLVPLLVPRLHLRLANVDGAYVEPFCGGASMGLAIGWSRSVYGDASPDLANLYQVVRDDPGALAAEIEVLGARGADEGVFYAVRGETWPERRGEITAAGWAARVVYLNRVGFNGLMRTNRRGQFNVPWGRRDFSPPSREHIFKAAAALRGAEVVCGDFDQAIERALKIVPTRRVVAFFDPPYGAKLKNVSTRGARERGAGSGSGVFTGYAGRFTWEDQVRLAQSGRRLAQGGAVVVASNTWDDAVCDLWREGFALFQVGVRHAVGATGARRGRRAEMVAVSEAHAGLFEVAGDLKVRRVR